MPDYVKTPFSKVEACKALATGHPVFLLLVDGKNPVVIKNESTGAKGVSATSLKHNFSLMKTVSAPAATKLLDNSELQAIDAFLATDDFACTVLKETPAPGIDYLRRCKNGMGGTWIKMAQAPGITDLQSSVLALVNDQDKTGVRAIAKSLNAPGGFEALGMIVAADLFNQNEDRCAPSGLGGSTALNERLSSGNNMIRYKVIGNAGNLLITLKNNKGTPIGLDSFDPNSTFSDTSKTIEALEQKTGDQWYGRYLSHSRADDLKKYSEEILDDLEAALGPRNRSGVARFLKMTDKRLNPDGATRILRGIGSGKEKLKAKLMAMISKNPAATLGLRSRLIIIT